MTPESSAFIIARDPFRSIRRGRQLFQRKFTLAQGAGPRTGDGIGNIEADASVAAGLADSCAACHGRPFGAAGFGGNVFTRPNSRDAPHLFGLGLVEMLGDEITQDLRAQRDQAVADAQSSGMTQTVNLSSKGVQYGNLTAFSDGTVDTSQVEGVDADLRVRPFFHQGGTISIREFIVGALNAEMGLEAFDPDTFVASMGGDVVTPAGMVLSGSEDAIEAPPVNSDTHDADLDGVVDEIPVSLVDHMEFYLLNYFKPGLGKQTKRARKGRQVFESIGCADCHVPDLLIQNDRRVADVETVFDGAGSNGVYNDFFATATGLFTTIDDGLGFPDLKPPAAGTFLVENIFADFKRHNLGAKFHEENFDGTVTTQFMTEPLWGVADTAPYGHDGRSGSLEEVIRRHGGEASSSALAFSNLPTSNRRKLLEFLGTLRLFSPEDTASNLNPADPTHPNWPLDGHGSISLAPLFNDPTEGE